MKKAIKNLLAVVFGASIMFLTVVCFLGENFETIGEVLGI